MQQDIIVANGHTYTRQFAWYPVRSTIGQWIWLDNYYIRPDRYFEGRLLSQHEFIVEISPPV